MVFRADASSVIVSKRFYNYNRYRGLCLSWILPDFGTAKTYICVIENLKAIIQWSIFITNYYKRELELLTRVWRRMARMEMDRTFKNNGSTFQDVSACLSKIAIYSRSLISIRKLWLYLPSC